MQHDVTRIEGLLNLRPGRQPPSHRKIDLRLLSLVFGFVLVKVDSKTKIYKTHHLFHKKKNISY